MKLNSPCQHVAEVHDSALCMTRQVGRKSDSSGRLMTERPCRGIWADSGARRPPDLRSRSDFQHTDPRQEKMNLSEHTHQDFCVFRMSGPRDLHQKVGLKQRGTEYTNAQALLCVCVCVCVCVCKWWCSVLTNVNQISILIQACIDVPHSGRLVSSCHTSVTESEISAVVR